MKVFWAFPEPWQKELIKRIPSPPWRRKKEAAWRWTGARKKHGSVKKLRYNR